MSFLIIYKVYLIDSSTGVSLFDSSFKELLDIQDDVISGFFSAINKTIDVIQASMSKGKRLNEMNRIIESEDSKIFIYFHPLSKILFCLISDADDETDLLEAVIHKIAIRFWKKHQSDLKIFRATTEKSRFPTLDADIENLTMGGKIAEVFPKLLVAKSVLEKVVSMGTISNEDFEIALLCNLQNSPLEISRTLSRKRNEIYEALKRLEKLDIIKI